MRYIFIAFCFILFVAASCQPKLDYQHDELYPNAAIAGKSEYPVYINNMICKDSSNEIGSCIFRVKRNKPLSIKVLPNPEEMTIKIACTTQLNWSKSADIPANVTKEYIIPVDNYDNVLSRFSCSGNIYPQSTPDIVKASFFVTIQLVDENYQPRTTPYIYDKWIVMGKHSRYLNCLVKNKMKFYKKKTAIKKKNVKYCWSISYKWRINYYGL